MINSSNFNVQLFTYQCVMINHCHSIGIEAMQNSHTQFSTNTVFPEVTTD